MIRKILRLFVDTFTVDDNHYPLNRENLTEPIQMQLSKKQKTFSEIYFSFLNSLLNFKHWQKKMTFIADVFPEIQAPKNMVRSISKKPPFRGPLDRQQGKCFETL